MSLARRSICTSPNRTESISSTFQSRPSCSGPSWVMTLMPAACARFSTGSQTFTSSGTRPITSTFLAIRSSSNLTCCAGSTFAGPTMVALMLKSFAPFWMPFSSALNHGMPAILTTVTISFGVSAQERPGRPATDIAVAPPISLSVSRLFIVFSPLRQLWLSLLDRTYAGQEQDPSLFIFG